MSSSNNNGNTTSSSWGLFNSSTPSMEVNIKSFVNPEAEDSVHTSALNSLLVQVKNDSTAEDNNNNIIGKVIGLLRSELTSESNNIRSRATLLLTEIIIRLPNLLQDSQANFLSAFFTERLSDFYSLSATLRGINALMENYPVALENNLNSITDTLFNNESVIHIPSLSQSLRALSYKVISNLLLTENNSSSLLLFVAAMEGEKDPRNLRVVLELMKRIVEQDKKDDDSVVVESVFQNSSAYFPITFTPPPNDPYGVTTEELKTALRSVFASSCQMAKFVIPFVIEKTEASVVASSKVDCLETLGVCIRAYDGNGDSVFDWLNKFKNEISRFLYDVAVTKSNEENEVIEAALRVVVQGFQVSLSFIKRAVAEYKSQTSLDSMHAIRTFKFIASVAASSNASCYEPTVVEFCSAMVSSDLEKISSTAAVVNTNLELVLRCVLTLLSCYPPHLSYSSSPLRRSGEYDLMNDICMKFMAVGDYGSEIRIAAIEICAKLFVGPPDGYALFSSSVIANRVVALTNTVVFDSNDDIRAAALKALKVIAAKSKTSGEFSTIVTEHCMPKLFEYFSQSAAGAPESDESAMTDGMSIDESEVSNILTRVLHCISELVTTQPSLYFYSSLEFLLSSTLSSSSNDLVLEAMVSMVEGIVAAKDENSVACMNYCVLGRRINGKASMTLFDLLFNETSNNNHIVKRGLACVGVATSVAARNRIFETILPHLAEASERSANAVTVACYMDYSTVSDKLHSIFKSLLQRFKEYDLAAAVACGTIANQLESESDFDWLKSEMSNDSLSATSTPFVYVTKALAKRSHPLAQTYLKQMIESRSEHFDILVASSSASTLRNSSAFASQRLYTFVRDLIIPKLREETECEYLYSVLFTVVASIEPVSIVLADSEIICPIVVASLKKSSSSSALRVLKLILSSYSADHEILKNISESIESVLVSLCRVIETGVAAKDRYVALECVGTVADKIEYAAIHSSKTLVIKTLKKFALDDKKQAVRRKGVIVANKWAIL